MDMDTLTTDNLKQLFETVFQFRPADKVLTFIVDVPNDNLPDHDQWLARRSMAYDWWQKASSFREDIGLETVQIFYYENVGSNNNNLPDRFYAVEGSPEQFTAEVIRLKGKEIPMAEVMAETDLIIAPTELSATAPCKMLAKEYDFRGTTMPGFIPEMLPALNLDYNKVHERIMNMKTRLDEAVKEDIVFDVRGTEYTFNCDLRNRKATASSGMFHDDKIVGNLPSGETYIVPYEGEITGNPSGSAGTIPVQFGEEIVLYRIEGNRAVEVLSEGKESDRQRHMLIDEPAYGNIAEIGHGVLGEFGLQAVGSLLMDEKLGLHIAFGRSEHFGGIVSPKSFNDPAKVVHIDRVYVESLQPDITIKRVVLSYVDGLKETIMEDSAWTV
ncbi:MAG: hypothetical protein CL946_08000 [Ectothiorhodospiraceae bacterium]|nr:hypothetical protein [Ectothiorhodospiraceae bacterium]